MVKFLPKAAEIETGKFLRLLITRNMDLHTRLIRVFRGKAGGDGKLLMIGGVDRYLRNWQHICGHAQGNTMEGYFEGCIGWKAYRDRRGHRD